MSTESWPNTWKEAGFLKNLVLLKLFPIVVALELWGESFRNSKVRFSCDNLGVVQVVNRISAESPSVVSLLRHLVLRCLHLNVFIHAVHLPVVKNTLADALSHFQWDRFQELAPTVERHGVPCPDWMWNIALTAQHGGSSGQ